MRTPLSFDKDTAILLASCCELTYEQYKQNGIFEIPDGFQYVQGFQGKAIQTTEWFGFILESEDTIIVAFRGTQTDPIGLLILSSIKTLSLCFKWRKCP